MYNIGRSTNVSAALRQQRWEVKKKQLAVAYAKNSLLPEMNVTALYRLLGLGNLYGTSSDNSLDFPDASSGSINELFDGDFQEFSLGIDYRIPIGLRRELSNVRNAQLKLARDIAYVEDMELDVTREISEAIRALDVNRRLMQSAFNRWKDTEIEKEHFDEIVELGLETLDVALEAQRRKTQAAAAFYGALCEYNKLIALIHRRKGTILAYNGIAFAEGAWPGKAYLDASENARRRGAGRPMNYGWTRPQVISQGSIFPPGDNRGIAGGQPHGDQFIDAEYYNNEPTLPEQTPERINGDMSSEPPASRVPMDGSTTRNEMLQSSRRSQLSSDSKPIVPTFVQQASYNEQVAAPSKQVRFAKPVNGDSVKQLPNVMQATLSKMEGRKPGAQTDASKTSQSIQAQATVSRPMNWEKFGLSRPGRGVQGTQAAIKNSSK